MGAGDFAPAGFGDLAFQYALQPNYFMVVYMGFVSCKSGLVQSCLEFLLNHPKRGEVGVFYRPEPPLRHTSKSRSLCDSGEKFSCSSWT